MLHRSRLALTASLLLGLLTAIAPAQPTPPDKPVPSGPDSAPPPSTPTPSSEPGPSGPDSSGPDAATPPARPDVFSELDLLVDIRHELAAHYVEEPDTRKMIDRAVRAMIESVEDPFTTYFAPEQVDPFDKQIRGTFSGIGAEVDFDTAEKRPRIVTPLDDSPAWKAGVQAGDILLEIDGQSTHDMTTAEAVRRITGPEGSTVRLRVRHANGEEAALEVTRAQINVQTVRGFRRDAEGRWDYMLDPAARVGYIRLSQFTEPSAAAVRGAVVGLTRQDVRGIILDLRFDPGGLLESAVSIADYFLPEGKTIVSVRGRSSPARTHASTGDDDLTAVPLIVLANEASASAAEILTGALSDNDRALFIGTRTFGKGSVQNVRPLDGGSGAIKITVAYYYLPNGRNIHRRPGSKDWGVDPKDGYYVPMSSQEVRTMSERRRERDRLTAGGKTEDPPISEQWILDALADKQLAAAYKAMIGRLETGDWPRVGESGAEDLALRARRESLRRQRQALSERVGQIDKELASLEPRAPSPTDASSPSAVGGDSPSLPTAAAPAPGRPTAEDR